MRRADAGVALLTALLVLALASALAYALLDNAQRALGAASATDRGLQARLMARGLEEFALSALQRDGLMDPGVDHLGEPWAGSLPPLPFDRGFVRARVQDLDGRLNLNALVRDDGTPDPVTQQRFERLLVELALPAELKLTITDWIDPDSQALVGGAEDLDYLRERPAWRCPNRALVDPSELLGVRGLDPATWRRLRPFVATLPRANALNVNTAPWQVLAAVVPGIEADMMERLRPDGRPWRDIAGFRASLADLQLALAPGQEVGLGVGSQFFLATADVELDGAGYQFQALLERSPSGMFVRWRQRGAER